MSGPGMYVPNPAHPFTGTFRLSDNLVLFSQVGSLPKNDIDVGTGLVGAPAYVLLPVLFLPAERG
jgi:hypothetical protein